MITHIMDLEQRMLTTCSYTCHLPARHPVNVGKLRPQRAADLALVAHSQEENLGDEGPDPWRTVLRAQKT